MILLRIESSHLLAVFLAAVFLLGAFLAAGFLAAGFFAALFFAEPAEAFLTLLGRVTGEVGFTGGLVAFFAGSVVLVAIAFSFVGHRPIDLNEQEQARDRKKE